MRQVSVVLARVLAYVESVDLNPGGTVFFPDLIRALVQKMEFQKYPTTFEEMDEEKGVNFIEGRWGHVTVDKLTIFRGALVVDTRVSTSDTEGLMHECLSWAADELGIRYTPEMIKRRQYISDLTFCSDFDLLSAHRAFVDLQRAVSEKVSTLLGQRLDYQFTRFDLDFDKQTTPLISAPFSIQRRGQVPFSEHKYFSEAALPTDIHIRLLEQFETDLQR
jgi:hypothetical protein